MRQSLIKTVIPFITLLQMSSGTIGAQEILTFDRYMDGVKSSNIAYLAERYNIQIAEAQLKASRILTDPELSIAYADNQNQTLEMGYSYEAELGYTLELGGKRRARIRIAKNEKEMTEWLVDNYFNNLRADALTAWFTALKQTEIVRLKQSTWIRMADLQRADSIRFRAGMIMEVNARESRLEAAIIHNERLMVEGDLVTALVNLKKMMGDTQLTLPDSISGTLTPIYKKFQLENLISLAEQRRGDLQATLKSKEMGQNQLKLAKANRMIDLGINIGVGYSSIVHNEIAPAPAFKSVGAGITIPLKFSSVNKGEILAAKSTLAQAELNCEAARQEIAAQVTIALKNYELSCKQMTHYDTGMLEDAEMILDKTIYSYLRGEAGILDVLNAHRTYNETIEGYYEALFNNIASLIELQRACGVGDEQLN